MAVLERQCGKVIKPAFEEVPTAEAQFAFHVPIFLSPLTAVIAPMRYTTSTQAQGEHASAAASCRQTDAVDRW